MEVEKERVICIGALEEYIRSVVRDEFEKQDMRKIMKGFIKEEKG